MDTLEERSRAREAAPHRDALLFSPGFREEQLTHVAPAAADAFDMAKLAIAREQRVSVLRGQRAGLPGSLQRAERVRLVPAVREAEGLREKLRVQQPTGASLERERILTDKKLLSGRSAFRRQTPLLNTLQRRSRNYLYRFSGPASMVCVPSALSTAERSESRAL